MAKTATKIRRWTTASILLLLVAGYVIWALAAPWLSLLPTVTFSGPSQTAANVPLTWPDYGESAVGALGQGILATHGNKKPLPTASIAKVMTAMAVLRQRPLALGEQGPTITLTQADVDSYNSFVAKDGSVVGVALGEQISEYQALEAMLLPSANNMAETLARWAFGSLDAYNAFANSYAKQLGLTSMHITDPSGLDEATVASAQDLTTLGLTAMLNPVFAQIVALPSATIPVAGTVSNYNSMLGHTNNVGIKTGNNDGDKGAFLFAAKQNVQGHDITIIGTIMGADDLASALRDSAPLVSDAAAGFTTLHVIDANQPVGSYATPASGQVTVRSAAALDILTWKGIDYHTTVKLRPVNGATPAGSQVGTVSVTNPAAGLSSEVPVTLTGPISAPGYVWRLKHPLGH